MTYWSRSKKEGRSRSNSWTLSVQIKETRKREKKVLEGPSSHRRPKRDDVCVCSRKIGTTCVCIFDRKRARALVGPPPFRQKRTRRVCVCACAYEGFELFKGVFDEVWVFSVKLADVCLKQSFDFHLSVFPPLNLTKSGSNVHQIGSNPLCTSEKTGTGSWALCV